MKILLLGAGGQLGNTFIDVANKNNIDITAFNRSELDITDANALETVFTGIKPDFVVNAAAYTAVDKAETEHDQAFLINETGPKNIALACAKFDATLIHISTDYVFNGEKQSAFREDDITDPINAYGLSKWRGEEAVRNTLNKHIILRVSWVFGLHGNNFVKTMLQLAKERAELNIVGDQYGCPTATESISKVILTIIEQLNNGKDDVYGTYHYCDKPVTNWYEFAQQIFAEAEEYGQLKLTKTNKISTKQYTTPAKRPRNSEMDCSLIKKTFGIEQYDWQQALNKVIKELEQQ